jgi:hypothetical protein
VNIQPPGFDQAQLLLKLQRRQCRYGAEMLVE